MGGADKGLLKHRGRPLVAHAIERLAPQVDRLLISANRNLATYRRLGFPVVTDALADFQGPLAGLAAGLAECTTDWLVCVPCDCPALPADLVERLFAAAHAGDGALAVARAAGRLQPTFLLCRREILPALTRYLAAGGRRVGQWCREQGALAVDFPDETAFENINSPAGLTK
ncbi:MAG: molybdenum cofactor guanylyltransferase [Rhodocyclaceae bacterium]|nr:molybdenum cofactor guanylyltransferase [Rhodocyclaceae bacterium]